MKVKTTVSEKTLAEYDRIMAAHEISIPYATDGDCFSELIDSELFYNPNFVLHFEWLEDEMREHIRRDSEMIQQAVECGEPGIPEARKDHAKFKRQHKAWVAKASSCPVREIEINDWEE